MGAASRFGPVSLARHRWGRARRADHAGTGFDIVANAPNGIGGTKGMDPGVVKILHDAFKKALDDPAFVATIKKFAQEIHYMASAEYHDYAVKQFEEERVTAEELGAKLD